MLEIDREQSPFAEAWNGVDLKTRLPETMPDFFECMGLTPARSGSRRAYPRFHIRGRGIVCRQGLTLGVYTCDASRGGVGFLAPVELQWNERVGIRLPDTKVFQINIVRCRRIDEACYECGAVFALTAHD